MRQKWRRGVSGQFLEVIRGIVELITILYFMLKGPKTVSRDGETEDA